MSVYGMTVAVNYRLEYVPEQDQGNRQGSPLTPSAWRVTLGYWAEGCSETLGATDQRRPG